MENQILKQFIDNKNNDVSKWLSNPKEFCKDNIYFRKTPTDSLLVYGMPEPYLGNPYKCSAVIININPGGIMCKYNCWNERENDKSFIKNYLMDSTYDNYALTFPYLLLQEDQRGTDWWISRNRWIQNICSNSKENSNNEELNPFAIELCPWHSERWRGMTYRDEELKKHIEQMVIIPAQEAVKNSNLLFGLCVGKPIFDALKELGFKEKGKWNNEKKADLKWPRKANKTEVLVSRNYSFLHHEELDASFLCTWARGGNKAPSNAFAEVENEIYSEIRAKILRK